MLIAICDDEKKIRDMLADKVKRLYPHAKQALFNSGSELLSADEHPDILLLDIQMSGKNGMETAKEFRKNNPKAILIFVTALEEYVFQSFDVGAFHYLVKPFTDEKFAAVLQNAVGLYHESQINMTQVSQSSPHPEYEEKSLIIKRGATSLKLLLSDIIYAEVFNRKVTIHKADEDIEYYGKLADLEKQTGEDFFRTHRAYLINFKYVMKYNSSMVWLEKGSALIAKSRFPEFVKKYLKYNHR